MSRPRQKPETLSQSPLQAQMDLVNEQERLLRAMVKNKKRQLKHATSRETRRMAQVRAVGLRVIALADDASGALYRYLAQHVGPGQQQLEDEHGQLLDRFLDLDGPSVLQLCEPVAQRDKYALRDAIDFMVRWDLVSWLSLQNISKGIAPSVSLVLQQRETIMGRLGRRCDSMARTPNWPLGSRHCLRQRLNHL